MQNMTVMDNSVKIEVDAASVISVRSIGSSGKDYHLGITIDSMSFDLQSPKMDYSLTLQVPYQMISLLH